MTPIRHALLTAARRESQRRVVRPERVFKLLIALCGPKLTWRNRGRE